MQEGHFHCSVKMVQRSKGRSATAAIAYRAGADITDERTGLRFDYTKKRGVSHSAIILPAGAPDKYKDRSTLWNTVEQKETKKNSAVAREYECALPFDLPREMRVQLGLDFAQYIVDRFGVAADINFHDPHPRETWDDGVASKNYHFHLLTSTRVLTEEGFGEKTRILDAAKTGGPVVEEIRAKLAELTNAALAKHRLEKFVDHRSYERRGIELEPQIHVGPNQDGDRAEQNAAIIAMRQHLEELDSEREEIQREIDALLLEQTPVGDTIPLFALVPATEEPRFPIETADAPVTPEVEPEQLTLDFTEPPVVTPVEPDEPEVTKPDNVIALDKVRRYNELEQLKKNAGTYTRAREHMREQNGLAASFQRELDELDRPGVLHRLWESKKWLAYEAKQADLIKRITEAKTKAKGLQAVAKEYKSFADQWDFKGGYTEHLQLTKDLAVTTPAPTVPSLDTGQSVSVNPVWSADSNISFR